MVAEYRNGSAAYVNYTVMPIMRSSSHCLSFWYFMFTGPVGSLAVYMTVDDSARRRVWQRQASHGGNGITGRWLQGEVQLSSDNFTLTEVPSLLHCSLHQATVTCMLFTLRVTVIYLLCSCLSSGSAIPYIVIKLKLNYLVHHFTSTNIHNSSGCHPNTSDSLLH